MDDLSPFDLSENRPDRERMGRRGSIAAERDRKLRGVAEKRRRDWEIPFAALDGDEGDARRRQRAPRFLRRVSGSVRCGGVSENSFISRGHSRRFCLREVTRGARESRESRPSRVDAAVGITSGAFGGGIASDD